MASFDTLPPDHRAVLQLVLQRGRSYDDIAKLLSIDRGAVRERAISALNALGPDTPMAPEQREKITDYLLGQLPEDEADRVKDDLAASPGDRAWARVVASELAPLADRPLPEIPAEGSRRGAPAPDPEPEPGAEHAPDHEPPVAVPPAPGSTPEVPAAPAAAAAVAAKAPGDPAAGSAADGSPPAGGGPGSTPPGEGGRPSSRRGGAILLGLGALVAIVVAVVLVIALSGGSSKPKSSTTAAGATTTATTTSATARPVAQINLTSPSGDKKVGGIAVVVKAGTTIGLLLRAQGVPANTKHDAYAVWLYNSPSDTQILGFVNPGVKSNGVLQTQGALPANASHFKQLLVSLETTGRPRAPHKIVLQGALSLNG